MSDKKRLLLLDGHALAYRAYHALPPMTSPSGEPTNAVLGFANMLLKAIQDYAPDYVAATFDVGRTFRHEAYADYKATRAETPDDLRVQFGRINELVQAFDIPIYTAEGYEADDVIGTISLQAAQQGLETIIVTGASDTVQLVGPGVAVLTPKRVFGETMLYDEAAVKERYGLEPKQLIDLKALTGDTSDNIPGVKGVGEKTATTLLQQYGSLDAIYEHLDEIKQTRFREALRAEHETALFSRRLVTIVRDAPVKFDLAACRWGEFDRARVMELLRALDLRSLVARIPQPKAPEMAQLGLFGAATPAVSAPTATVKETLGNYHTVDTKQALDDLAARLRRCSRLAFDTETTSTDPMRAALVGISLSDVPGEAFYVPVGHDRRLNVGAQLPLDLVRARLGPILADAKIAKLCHNAKFDMTILAQHGMPVEGVTVDTMIAAWILEPSGRGIGLKNQAWQRLGVEMTEIEELIGKGAKQISMDQVKIDSVTPYACADADMTLRLADVLLPELERQQQSKLFYEIEMPLVPVLVNIETHGMMVDMLYLEEMGRNISQKLDELEAAIYRDAGRSFNIKSTQQLAKVLFDELGLAAKGRTRTGSTSTDVEALEQLRDEHPIIEKILEYRQYEKIRSTYVDALIKLVHPRTGRVHTSFNQTSTITGRLSSSDPNLQNIPVRTELGRQVRGAFIAPEGHWLLSCDYSQVELRLLAHISQDPELLGAFHRDEDVHASTAAAVFGVPLAEVSKDQRQLAKAINFGLMYGMGDYGLSARANLTVPQAREFIDAYFGRFRRVKEYLDETIRSAHELGYVETLLGRRRYFPELKSSATNVQVRRAAERAAINMPIQGTAADIMKLAMIALDRALRVGGYASRMVLQVHDELVLEVPERELEVVQALAMATMENAYKLDVRLKVDAAVGKNWMEMK